RSKRASRACWSCFHSWIFAAAAAVTSPTSECERKSPMTHTCAPTPSSRSVYRQLPRLSRSEPGSPDSGGPLMGPAVEPYQTLRTVGVISAFTGPTRQRASSSSTSANGSTLLRLSVVSQRRLPLESRSSCAISYDHHTQGRLLRGAAVGAGPAGC